MKTIIFDMDGVILDDEYPYLQSAKAFLESKGKKFPIREIAQLIGMTDIMFYQKLGELLGVDGKEAKRQKDIYNLNHPFKYEDFLKKDAINLLEYLSANAYEMVLATAAYRENTRRKLNYYSLHKYFKIVVCGDDVKRVKPYPDIYLRALELIGKDKKDCIVIEDSTIGIKAAKRAGLTVIADYDKRIGNDVSQADYVITDLLEAIDIIKGEY